jgi:3-oxoacyl-[acyl-carrier-protein] synthase-1
VLENLACRRGQNGFRFVAICESPRPNRRARSCGLAASARSISAASSTVEAMVVGVSAAASAQVPQNPGAVAIRLCPEIVTTIMFLCAIKSVGACYRERRMINIVAAGAITPVGVDLTSAMAGLYSRIQLFQDLDVLDGDGEPLSGMKIPFTDDMDGPTRLTEMAHAIVAQCAVVIEPVTEKIPLFLCCPEPDAFPQADWASDMFAKVVAKAAVPIDRQRSRLIAQGRSGALEALGAALKLLQDPSVRYCLVGGVDSLITSERAQSLYDAERLLTDLNKDGFVASESGAMLVLSNRPHPESMANLLSAAGAQEEAVRGSQQPITGRGLQEAMTKALAQAQITFEALAALAPDFSGEQQYFEESVMANSRLAKGPAKNTVEIPALSVGEVGAAAGFLSLAMMAFLHWKGVHTQPSMTLFTDDGPGRGAVVLAPVARH